MAFPSTPIIETFTGTVSSDPPAGWTKFNLVGAIGRDGSGRGAGKTSAENIIYYSDSQFGPDTDVYVFIPVLPGDNRLTVVSARLKDVSDILTLDGYQVAYEQLSDTDEIRIERLDNAAATVLATYNQNLSAGNGIGIRVVGDTIEAWYYNGTSWASLGSPVTDNTYPDAGYVGLAITNTTGRADDYGAGGVVNTATSITSASTTSDDASIVVARVISTAINSASTTPDSSALTIVRAVATSITSASSTPDSIGLTISRAVAVAINSQSTTPDDVAVTVVRAVAVVVSSQSTTPDDITLTVSGVIDAATAIASQSATPDDITLEIVRAISAAVTSTSSTPNGATLGLGLVASTAISSGSTTPDNLALTISRAVVAAISSESTTPDIITLMVLRAVVAAIVSQSTTPDDITLQTGGVSPSRKTVFKQMFLGLFKDMF